MKKRTLYFTIILGVLFAQHAVAQTYKTQLTNNASNGIEFSLSRSDISIEGHNSSEVIIENTDYEAPPERARGLKPLYGGGTDNTGIGLSVEEENGILKIVQTSSNSGDFKVMVPNKIRVLIEEVNWGGGDIEIRNHAGEIEIQSKNGDINLQNVSGPVIAHSTSGDADIVFSEVSNATPTSISLISGYIDVTLPASTRADFRMSSISGEIYTDMDIQMEGGKEGLSRLGGGRKIEGTLNGGGVEMGFKTISGDIYLRKK